MNRMTSYSFLSRKERLWLSFFFFSLGLLLALGFVDASRTLFLYLFGPLLTKQWPEWPPFAALIAFPLLSLVFYLSLPSKAVAFPGWAPSPMKSSALPLACALGFGILLPAVPKPLEWVQLIWIGLSVPVAEELLFRGWVWNLTTHLAGSRLSTFTSPLPAPVLYTSLCFAVWHLQNLSVYSVPATLWQILYTFFASIWLCSLRTTWGLGAAIAGHIALNAATVLGQRLWHW